MKCPLCKGTGTQTLHGAAIPMEEFMGPDWDDDMREGYTSGLYDHACYHCGGTGETTREGWDWYQVELQERRMGA